MIGDLICDRKAGQKYSAREFYFAVMNYRDLWPEWTDNIARAMDEGEEEDVKRELCRYIDEAGWNPQVKDYVNSVTWLEDDAEHSFPVEVTFPKDRRQHDGSVKAEPYTFTTWVEYEVTPDGHLKTETDRDGIDTLQRRMMTQAWTLAEKMGWELWMPLDVEIPLAHLTLHMGPKDTEEAREIQTMLDQARQRKEPFRAEMEVEATAAAR